MIKSLPNEIWSLIFSYANIPSLLAIALTSHYFHSLSTPLLYHSIILSAESNHALTPLLAVFSTERGKKYASFLREFTVVPSGWDLDNLRCILEMEELERLKTLVIEVDGDEEYNSFAFHLFGATGFGNTTAGVTFKLTTFSSDMICDAHLYNFLHDQPLITSLTLGGTFVDEFLALIKPPNQTLSFLPELKSLDSDPDIAQHLVPNRPLSIVQLPLLAFDISPLSPGTVSSRPCLPLSSLVHSTSPLGVTQLILLLPRISTTSPNKLISQIADNVPQLEQLSIYFGMGCVFDLVRSFSQVMEGFSFHNW